MPPDDEYGWNDDEDNDAVFQQMIDTGNWSFDSLGPSFPDPWTNLDNPTHHDSSAQASSSAIRHPPPIYLSLPQPANLHSASFPTASSTSQDWPSDPAPSTSNPAPSASTAADYANSQQPHVPAHRRSIQPTFSTRGLAPVSAFTEDWLDLSETAREIGHPPFIDYTRESIFDDSSESERGPFQAPDTDADMPRATRSRQGLSVVDLTNEPTSPAQSSRKRKHGRVDMEDVEALDLTNEAPSLEEELLQNQQQEAINAQKGSDQAGPQRVGKLTCNICLENFTNATVTACGHIFCHECITQALIASERSNDTNAGKCPLCRKVLSRRRANNMIPIQFMKRSAFKGRHGIPR